MVGAVSIPHVSGNEACAMWKPHVSGNEARAVANRTFLVTKLVRYGNRTYRRFYTNKNSRASLHRSRLFLFTITNNSSAFVTTAQADL
jgi:hypothetical protein